MKSIDTATHAPATVPAASAEWVQSTEQRVGQMLEDIVSDGHLDTAEMLALLDAQGQAKVAITTTSKQIAEHNKALDQVVANLKA